MDTRTGRADELPARGAGRRIRKRAEGPYSRARCGEPSPPALLQGIAELNRGEFFEQHETLEALWREEPDDVRYLYQGILLVGVGCYHLLRGNYVGAASKLSRGLSLLRWFEPACQGVDVARLVADTARCEAALRALGSARVAELDRRLLPRVYLARGACGSPQRADSQDEQDRTDEQDRVRRGFSTNPCGIPLS